MKQKRKIKNTCIYMCTCTCKYMYTHFIEVGDDPIWLTGTDTERDTPPEGGVAKKE